jgi:hypothetical protein
MNDYLIDLKALGLFSCFTIVSFADNVEFIMKVISFFLMAGYTARRWYLLEKNKNK